MVNAVLTYQNIPTGYQASSLSLSLFSSLFLFLSFFVSVSLTIREDTPSSLVVFASSLLGTRSDISSRLHRLSLSPFSVAFFLFHRGPVVLLRAPCPLSELFRGQTPKPRGTRCVYASRSSGVIFFIGNCGSAIDSIDSTRKERTKYSLKFWKVKTSNRSWNVGTVRAVEIGKLGRFLKIVILKIVISPLFTFFILSFVKH